MLFCGQLPTFQSNVLYPSSETILKVEVAQSSIKLVAIYKTTCHIPKLAIFELRIKARTFRVHVAVPFPPVIHKAFQDVLVASAMSQLVIKNNMRCPRYFAVGSAHQRCEQIGSNMITTLSRAYKTSPHASCYIMFV